VFFDIYQFLEPVFAANNRAIFGYVHYSTHFWLESESCPLTVRLTMQMQPQEKRNAMSMLVELSKNAPNTSVAEAQDSHEVKTLEGMVEETDFVDVAPRPRWLAHHWIMFVSSWLVPKSFVHCDHSDHL
jgi:hypothetical protein